MRFKDSNLLFSYKVALKLKYNIFLTNFLINYFFFFTNKIRKILFNSPGVLKIKLNVVTLFENIKFKRYQIKSGGTLIF